MARRPSTDAIVRPYHQIYVADRANRIVRISDVAGAGFRLDPSRDPIYATRTGTFETE